MNTPSRTRFYVCFRVALIIFAAACIGVTGCSKEPAQTLTIVYSNDLNGVIRSCGCPINDNGGLGRRATFTDIVRDSTTNFLLVDAGDFFGREVNYGKEKADITMKSMGLMGYHGVAIGENEFGFGADYIVDRVNATGLPVLGANVYDGETSELLFPPSWVVEYPGGLEVGLIGVMGSQLKLPPQVEPGSVRITDPVNAVRREVAELGEGIDVIVVLAHVFLRDAQAIASSVPEVDLVIFGHEGRPIRKLRRHGNAFLLQVPKDGTHAGAAFAVIGEDGGIRTLSNYMKPLSREFEDHEAIARLFQSYDMNVAAKEKSNVPSGLFERRLRLPKPYPGSEACAECHEEEYAAWSASAHARAMATLEAESREYDRDCIPCHTTGFYKRGGFEHVSVTPGLINVGCESCHGSGFDHVAGTALAFEGDPGAVCLSCHTDRQDPDFDFEADWPLIRH